MKKKLFNTKKIKIINNPKGDILLGIKKHDNQFKKFNELYFSKIKYNNIKAWKKHKKATMNILVPYGKIKFVIFDEKNNLFYSEVIGENNYKLLTIYPNVTFGFQGLFKPFSILTNLSNYVNNAKEYDNIDLKKINFDWKK